MRYLAILLLVVVPCVAQETVPDTLALDDEDAKTCQVKGCRTITDGAFNLIAERLHRLEEENKRLAEEMKKLPKKVFCS